MQSVFVCFAQYVVTKKSQKLSFKYLSIFTFVLKIITLAENNAKSIASILRWRFGQELFFGGTDNF